MTSPEEVPPTPSTPTRAARTSRRPLIAFILGCLLLGAAVLALAGHRAEFHKAVEAARTSPWWLAALALVLPLVNWLLMSLSFWILMRRHGRIGLGEMSCLIGAAWLLNYLPLRPGLLGRVAYHKAVNGIPIARSIGVTITSIACAGVAIGVALALGAMLHAARAGPIVQLLVIAAFPVAICGPVAVALSLTGRPWWIIATVGLRYVDLLVWAGRYAVVFSLVGQSIPLTAAVIVAAVSQVAMLVPLVGNGLGLREWAVGAVAGVLPPGILSRSGTLTTTLGLAADLINRVAEVVIAIPLGLTCAHLLARRTAPASRP